MTGETPRPAISAHSPEAVEGSAGTLYPHEGEQVCGGASLPTLRDHVTRVGIEGCDAPAARSVPKRGSLADVPQQIHDPKQGPARSSRGRSASNTMRTMKILLATALAGLVVLQTVGCSKESSDGKSEGDEKPKKKTLEQREEALYKEYLKLADTYSDDCDKFGKRHER